MPPPCVTSPTGPLVTSEPATGDMLSNTRSATLASPGEFGP